MTISNVIGSVILITIFEHYCTSLHGFVTSQTRPSGLTCFVLSVIIVAVVVLCGYAYFQQYYQKTGRELKRIDSMLRSLLYSVSRAILPSADVCPADSPCPIFGHIQHFSESLSGLATIRAYGEANRFIKENEHRMDVEDRAYILYTSTQRVSPVFTI